MERVTTIETCGDDLRGRGSDDATDLNSSRELKRVSVQAIL